MLRRRTLLIGMLAFFLIGSMFPSWSILTLSSIPKAHAVSRSIKLTGASYTGWNGTNPGPTVTVTKGDGVSMSLVSGDGAPHTFIVDVDKDGVIPNPTCSIDKCSPQFSTSTPYPFVVDFGPGTFTYYCSIHLTMMVGTFIVSDFGVSSSPFSLTIPQGSNANSTVSITSLNNYAGAVTLSATPPTSWPPPFFGVNPVPISSGMTSTSKLTIYVPPGTSPGPYGVTVTASDSFISHSTNVAVNVPAPSFTVSASPATLTINSGSSGTSTITVAGSYGFSGTVSLSATVPSGRATTILSSASVMLSATATSATSMLTVSSALGMFNVTVTATSGSTAPSTLVAVNGPDFSIKTSPSTVSLSQGSSAMLAITLSSVNGFSGFVALSASPSTGGPPVTVSPTSLQVPSSGSVSATLTVTASSSGTYSTPISPGSYTITLNATMGSLSHTETIPLTVTSLPSGAGILTSPIVIGGIAAAITVVAGIIYVIRRRPKANT